MNFQKVNSLIKIEDVAIYLLGQSVRGMYKYPGEKNPSIKIYTQTNSFFDYGRSIGGDAVRLWSHIRGMDNWTALQELAACFGISLNGNEDRATIQQKIRKQELAQREAAQAKTKRREAWRQRVDGLKEQERLYDRLLHSEHIPPFSEVWCWCANNKQLVDYKLDILCGIYGGE